jgi:hypothetical protein
MLAFSLQSLVCFSSFLPLAMRFPVGIFGQAIVSVAYPFTMFLPSKVSIGG